MLRTILIFLFSIGIILSFHRFNVDNNNRIEAQTKEYINELTIQGARSFDNLLLQNLGFIKTTAFLYGKSLTSSWADVASLRRFEKDSSFEHLRFIDASGDDYTSKGVMANLIDRDYFRQGMSGETGVVYVSESRVTDKGQLGFYSPVFYNDEIIGIMAGFYGEDYLQKFLNFSLFGYEGENWLLERDGSVIASTSSEDADNFLSYMEKKRKISHDELKRIAAAIKKGENISFLYMDGSQEAASYAVALSQVPWILVRSFPASATGMLQATMKVAGERLITVLLTLFLLFAILFAIGLILELVEKRKTIQNTERDTLTGLYNIQYFYHYVDQFDQHHKSSDMDALVIDVDGFRMINERYGRSYGDKVLKRMGEALLQVLEKTGGVLCRRGGDVFMLYCPHQEDYSEISEAACVQISEDSAREGRIRIRMGVYQSIDKSMETPRRFDRAKRAADSIRGNYNRSVAFYDERMSRLDSFEHRLIGDFTRALQNEEFLVYLQPKFNIQNEIPVPSGAEALVRWQHSELGLLGPSAFIPLFEKNGLIQQLDLYVWRRTAALLQKWKRQYGCCLPVSINISRVDMYNPDLSDIISHILEEYGLQAEDFFLEITESAYMDDPVRMIKVAANLRAKGFRLEIDDFGAGYSSLNMINDLPVDVLKIDISFIKSAFKNGKDTSLLEIILEIARHLKVPAIAEGVETLEQLKALKSIGCDYVQGYYFSKPIPPEEFEIYIGKVLGCQKNEREQKE